MVCETDFSFISASRWSDSIVTVVFPALSQDHDPPVWSDFKIFSSKKASKRKKTVFFQATDDVIGRFQEAIRLQTISRDDGDQNFDELAKFVTFIRKGEFLPLCTAQNKHNKRFTRKPVLWMACKYLVLGKSVQVLCSCQLHECLSIVSAFPLVHFHPLVTYEIVNKYSLLYHVKGRPTGSTVLTLLWNCRKVFSRASVFNALLIFEYRIWQFLEALPPGCSHGCCASRDAGLGSPTVRCEHCRWIYLWSGHDRQQAWPHGRTSWSLWLP